MLDVVVCVGLVAVLDVVLLGRNKTKGCSYEQDVVHPSHASARSRPHAGAQPSTCAAARGRLHTCGITHAASHMRDHTCGITHMLRHALDGVSRGLRV